MAVSAGFRAALAGAVLVPVALSAALAGAPDGRPARIVSLNLCTDELALRLADPDRLVSVTWLSQDPRNGNLAEAARRHRANHGLVEEILPLAPDLVVAGRYTTRHAVAMLKRAGIRVVEFDIPKDLTGVKAQIVDFAAAIGEPARGRALVAQMDAELARLALSDPRAAVPRAFVLRPNGFTPGRGSLVDDVLTAAGFDNLGASLDLGAYAQVPLERVVLERADALIVDTEPDGPPSLATAVLTHPILRALSPRPRLISIPSRLWTCAGPSVVAAIARLRSAAADLQKGGRP
ncbi:ABC transporter substrate-binding protein [Enterovirga rhinocerotis]|uniref:Iron complex transport system substrate-binding protein n=1 Tax=Enterovirga rhinocerotis TaxID=1339210 RepID=A0A4R7BZ09_9HYPH|nr:ABC transporter substrate-binding protein [Enterovirga rhinocerotis]TDR89296.1 iron complex transport system substrate-binding protein [Enterovirga rhinocerotis]